MKLEAGDRGRITSILMVAVTINMRMMLLAIIWDKVNMGLLAI
jgi:hypothetical protein